MSVDVNKMPCVICGNAASLMCQRCGEPYCNEVCQRKDWQRHKYICTIMPSLVSLNISNPIADLKHEATAAPATKNATMPKESPNQSCCPESMTKDVPIESKLSMAWREPLMPKEKEFFECRVTYIEKDGPIWVVNVANAERLERLTDKIARSMLNQKSCSYEELIIGNLVGVAVDRKMYRGQVIALNANVNGAEVRLIDYGAVVACDVHDIYMPVQRMAEYKAFGLRVKLPTNTGVQINKNLTLRLLGSQTPDGIEQVLLKPKMTIPLSLPVQMLASNPEVGIVRILQNNPSLGEPQVALLEIKGMHSVNEDLNDRLNDMPGQLFTEPFPEEIRTFFLAARTKKGYRRALLIDFIKQPMLFLVYEMDEGSISLTTEVRRIPIELLGHPLRVFAVTFTAGKIPSLKQALTQCGSELCIRFNEESIQGKDMSKLRTAQAALLTNNNEQVCDVRANTFLGRVSELGHKYWRNPIENGSLVYMSHIINYDEICISSVETKLYEEIFKCLESKCPPIDKSDDIPIGKIVLVVSSSRGNYRAEITEVDEKKYLVMNIDTGSKHQVTANHLRQPCRFIENLPVSQCRVKIKTICNIPSTAVPSNSVALQMLMKLFAQKTEMQVEFEESDKSTVDLLDFSVEPRSLMTRMLPMMFTPVAVELKPAQSLPATPVAVSESIGAPQAVPSTTNPLPSLPPSPPNSPNQAEIASKPPERYYFNDVERRLLPLGIDLHVLILNVTNLHKTGYVTACYFCSERDAENFQKLLDRVAEIGASDDNLKPGYLPDVGEMCLALFAEDNSWYRGICIRVGGQKATILYCDFGNSEVVSLERIKPIPEEVMEAVYATKCFIDGFDITKNFSILEQYLTDKNKIACNVVDGPEPNTRLIKIPILEKILSKELI